MGNSTSAGITRRKTNAPLCCVSLALTALVLLGLAVPGGAGQLPKDQVPFTVTFKPVEKDFPIPSDPPIVPVEASGTGQSDLLGQVTVVGHYIMHLGVDGEPLFATEGLQVLTAANGDAVFQSFVGLPQAGQGAWIVTGGKGRFLGATGSGTFTFRVDNKGQLIVTETGTISAPKP